MNDYYSHYYQLLEGMRWGRCKHAVPGTGRPGYKGFEVCPYCGAFALMFTKFQPVADDDEPQKPQYPEDFKKMKKAMRGVGGMPTVDPLIVASSKDNLHTEAVYLAILTARNVKPLSRIEYVPERKTLDVFDELNLITEGLTQVTRGGSAVPMTLISNHWYNIAEVRKFFELKPLNLSPKTVRKWGKVLGYPKCCVEFFANEETRHSPNNFSAEEQKLLFHWACPDCQITKGLISVYRKIWEEAKILASK